MLQPLVSVIIPVYNVEEYIVKCVESVLEQTYEPIEILLIDDCSPDQSVQKVCQYLEGCQEKAKVRVIAHQVNKGLSEARNTGLIDAKGAYIYFLDSDDWISKDCISLLVASAQDNSSEVVVGNTICYLEKEKQEKMVFPIRTTSKVLNTSKEVFRVFTDGGWPVMAHNRLYDRKFLEEHQLTFYPGLLGEDELWAFQWALLAEKVSIVNNITYYYRLRENSIISTKTKKNFEDMLFILEKFSEAYRENKDKELKTLIMKRILKFKEMLLIMQWRSLHGDKEYLEQNYRKLKSSPQLEIKDYLSPQFSITEKKKSLLLHLPAFVGIPFFIWRYER